MRTRKTIRYLCVILLGVCIVTGIATANSPERRTLRCFNTHKADLIRDIEHGFENNDPSGSPDIRCSYWDGEHPIMEYIVVDRGIVPASKYYGFFYSFDGVPVPFQNAEIPMTTVSDTEWEWSAEGDNHGIVRRLEENWFYFEAFL